MLEFAFALQPPARTGLESYAPMPLRLTLCKLCTKSRPAFARMVEQLRCEYEPELVVIELECMAACDDVPAVMLELDYFPQLSPQELRAHVTELLEAEAQSTP